MATAVMRWIHCVSRNCRNMMVLKFKSEAAAIFIKIVA